MFIFNSFLNHQLFNADTKNLAIISTFYKSPNKIANH